MKAWFLRLIRPPVKKQNLVQFYQQLSTLIYAGFSLLRGLNVCIGQTSDGALKDILQMMSTELEGGAPLSQVLEKFPRIFTPFHLGMVKTAERSGTLPEVLKYLAQFEENEMKLRQKVHAALAYPIFVTITAFIVIILLTRYLCPLLDSVTAILGRDKIPLITRGLIFIGKCSTDIRYIAAIAVIVVIVILGVRALMRSGKIRYLLGRLRLRLPIFGKVQKNIIMVRLCRVLSTLLAAGVPSVLSIRIVDEVADNFYFSEAVIKKIIWRVDEGKLFSEAFSESRFFPVVFINMLVVGEQTGKLPFILGKLADLFEIDVNMFLDSIASVLEPFLVLIMGCITFLILLGAFLPMYAIMSGI